MTRFLGALMLNFYQRVSSIWNWSYRLLRGGISTTNVSQRWGNTWFINLLTFLCKMMRLQSSGIVSCLEAPWNPSKREQRIIPHPPSIPDHVPNSAAEWGKIHPEHLGYKATKRAFEKSLQRLKTNYVDVMMLPGRGTWQCWGWLEMAVQNEEWWWTMTKVQPYKTMWPQTASWMTKEKGFQKNSDESAGYPPKRLQFFLEGGDIQPD